MKLARHRLMPILAAVAMLAASGVFAAAAPAQAATTTLCNSQTAAVAGGAYTVQNNEWNSSAPECVTTDGNADFTVANTSINNAVGGAPASPTQTRSMVGAAARRAATKAATTFSSHQNRNWLMAAARRPGPDGPPIREAGC